MKKLIVYLLLIALSALGASAQSAFFKKCEKMPGVQTVYISKMMLGMASKAGVTAGKMDVTSLVDKLDGLEIITAEGKSAAKLAKQIEPFADYETLLSINDDNENVKLLFKDLGNGQNEFRLVASEPEELTLILFRGTMTMEEVIQVVKM